MVPYICTYIFFLVDMQVLSIVMSLIKMSMTTALFQRFQSQNIAGREYPWDKVKEKERKLLKNILPTENQEDDPDMGNPVLAVTRRASALSTTSIEMIRKIQEEKERQSRAPMKIDSVKGLSDDDTAGKLIAILWWFCFLLPRMLTLSIFTYFFPREAVLLCVFHYLIVLGLLIKYTNFKTEKPTDTSETEADGFTRRKKYDWINELTIQQIAFFLIMSYIYIFCLIEIKIRFTRVKIVYYCYFIIVYLQNFIMMYMWYYHVEKLQTWWYDYLFYIIVVSTILSLLSMAMYLSSFRPRKVLVKQWLRNSQLM